jgi:hypothetical protein
MGNKIPKIYLQAMINDYPIIKYLLTFYAFFLFLNFPYMAYPIYQIVVEEKKLFSTSFDVKNTTFNNFLMKVED